MKSQRLDEILFIKGLTADKREAFVLVTEGRVFVNGQKAVSPAQMVSADDRIEVRPAREFVGRGAEKLRAAIEHFGVDVSGKICADVGAATGGFTEVLLNGGARQVYAIDTARGKLDIKLRNDPRVVVREGEDIRDIKSLPEEIELVSADVSLISLREILPVLRRISPQAEVIALFKPQYETRDLSILRHGVIRDDAARQALLSDFKRWLRNNNWKTIAFMESPIRGAEGNVEYLFYLQPA